MDDPVSRFVLSVPIIGGVRVNITEQEFIKFRASAVNLIALETLEELFNVVGQCLVSFERQLLDASLFHAIDAHDNHQLDFVHAEFRAKINVEILSLLNACHAYCDQAPRLLEKISPSGSAIAAAIKSSFSEAFDSSIEYRICCALRNHSQHSSLPVETFSYGMFREWEEGHKGPSRGVVTVSICIKSLTLVHNKHLRKKTRNEIMATGYDYIELRAMLRAYLAKLFECHAAARAATEAVLEDSASAVVEAYSRLSIAANQDVQFAHVHREEGEKTYINRDIASLIQSHRRRWSGLRWFFSFVISNEIRRNDKVYLGDSATVLRR